MYKMIVTIALDRLPFRFQGSIAPGCFRVPTGFIDRMESEMYRLFGYAAKEITVVCEEIAPPPPPDFGAFFAFAACADSWRNALDSEWWSGVYTMYSETASYNGFPVGAWRR